MEVVITFCIVFIAILCAMVYNELVKINSNLEKMNKRDEKQELH